MDSCEQKTTTAAEATAAVTTATATTAAEATTTALAQAPRRPGDGSLRREDERPHAAASGGGGGVRMRRTYEDMDIFYYKQIATRMQDFDLQKKIEHELKMCDGATKLLAAVQNSGLSLEAAKTLLTCNVRMAVYAEALRQKKSAVARCLPGTVVREGSGCGGHSPTDRAADLGMKGLEHVESNSFASKARVAISDIRIPLAWKDPDNFKNKSYHKKFAVFGIFRIATEVYETCLVPEIDRTAMDVVLDDYIVFNDVPHDFVCNLDIYAHELCEDSPTQSAPVRLRRKINDISNTVGRRLSGFVEVSESGASVTSSTYRKQNAYLGRRLSGLGEKEPADGSMTRDDPFELVAQVRLSLRDCKDCIDTHELTFASEHVTSLPLSGSISCRIVAQPHSLTRATVSGYLLVKEPGSWRRRWCVLQRLCISCWSTPFEADLLHPPALEVPITKDFIISDADPTSADRPLMFHVRSLKDDSCEYSLASESADDLAMWWDGFHQHLLDQVIWGHACESLMKIRAPATSRPYLTSRARAYSLYDKSVTKEIQRTSNNSTGAAEQPLSALFNQCLVADSHSRWQTSRQESFSNMSL